MADPTVAKPGRGKGKKVDDKWIVPLSRVLHDEVHQIGEPAFETKYGVDLVKISMGLWINSRDDQAGLLIVKNSIKKDR